LWFSWKYINGVNYWEENQETGRSDGLTEWRMPLPTTARPNPEELTAIFLDLAYQHPSGRTDLTEKRQLLVSRPAADGSYWIDWQSNFVAGPEGALLDRTPMPGEPNGQVNGGYAGLGLRLAPPPLAISFVTSEGPVDTFVESRARPNAAAVAANFRDGDRDVGGIAVISDPANSGALAPWYIVDNEKLPMRFFCAAVLGPKPIQLEPKAVLRLQYRVALRPQAWTPESLKELAATVGP
jgi:hypothetical protein